MRIAPFLLIAAFPCIAQTPASLEILADQSQVVVGRTVQARAYVHDSTGKIIDTPVTWSLNQPNAATISTTGLVTAKGLATVRLTARAGSITGEAAIQCIPAKMEVTPGATEVRIGTRTKFSAAAYDADGNVIPGVNMTWSLTNQRAGGSSLGTIDNTGMLNPTGEGGLWVWATYNYNETFPGLQQRWVAYSPVKVSVPQSYELRKLFSSMEQMRSNWTLRPRQSMIWSTDDGQLFFNASLSGLSNGLLTWNNNVWKMVTVGGVPRFGRGSTALDFRTHAISRDGKILTYEDTNINGAELNYGTVDGGMELYFANSMPLGRTEATSGLYINRNSLTSTGLKMVRANFRFTDNPINYVGLFRGDVAPNEMLISTQEVIAGVASPFNIDTDFGIAGNGTAFYSITSGTNRVFFKHDYESRKRLIGVGDTLGTSKIRSFLGGRTNQPATWFDEDGTAIVTVVLEDNTQWYVAFAPDGTSRTLRLTSQIGILWRNSAQGVLLYANPFGSRGNGVYLWQGTTATPVYVLGTRLFDQTIQEIESGTMDGSGAITLLLRGDRNALMGVRMGDTPFTLFTDGDNINLDLPVNLFTLIGGARTGPPHAQAGGNSGSISRFMNGEWETTLGIGERLFGSTMWYGGSHGTTYNMRKAPNGDVYMINNLGIAKITPGGDPQSVLAFPLRIDTLTVNNPGQFDVNANGDLMFASSTSAGDNRLFTWINGQVKQILIYSTTAATAQTIGGNIASSFDSFAFDSTGRVMAQLRFRNVTLASIAIWDGNAWTIAALPNSTKVGNRTITNFPTIIRATGNHLIAGLVVDGIGNILAEWQGSSWKSLVDITTIMPNGQVANSIAAADVNTNGDVLFQFANGVNSMVVLKNGALKQVHNFFQPTPAGEFLIRTNAMDLRDDGTVYFLAVNQFDEVVLYEAKPLQ